MAKGQSGVSSSTIGMIVFAALWLAATVFLVILYTGQEDLKNDRDRMAAQNSKLITPNEERSLELAKSAREGGPTVVGLIEEARSRTAELASGTPADSVAAIKTKRDALISSIRSDGVVDAASVGYSGTDT